VAFLRERVAPATSRKLVKKEIDGGNLALPDDYEIGSGVPAACQGRPTPTGSDRHRPSPQGGDRLISEVRMRGPDHARDAVDLVAAAANAVVRAVEHSVFAEDLFDRCASTHGINLTEHVVKIAK